MEKISVRGVAKSTCELKYEFDVTEGLSLYFSGEPFVIEYPVDVSAVPDAIAVIPFICNVLPIIWLTDSELVVPEIDRAFYECIPDVKKGYEVMFPESTFAGRITAGKVVDCDREPSGRSAAFFSGGLDATQTLVSHFDEKPDLISIWGSDIRYDNVKGWEAMHSGIAEVARRYGLADVVIRSSFRSFDSEKALGQKFADQLKDGWWHGVKHGIGLLGHAAPYVYLNGISTAYIASSNCAEDGPVRCASNPSIDNHVRFANCRIVHDGYEFSRQQKARNVVEFHKNTGNYVSLHVCWESQDGGNCCQCEKCYRTMAALMAEGADPCDFGFSKAPNTIPQMRGKLLTSRRFTAYIAEKQWTHIQKRIVDNRDVISRGPYWKHIRWIAEADFANIGSIKLPMKYRVRRWLSKFKFYQKLHKLKRKK